MTQRVTNATFAKQLLGNTTGVDDIFVQLTVEIVVSDPIDLATNFPRVWINSTSNLMKYTTNGTVVRTVATV